MNTIQKILLILTGITLASTLAVKDANAETVYQAKPEPKQEQVKKDKKPKAQLARPQAPSQLEEKVTGKFSGFVESFYESQSSNKASFSKLAFPAGLDYTYKNSTMGGAAGIESFDGTTTYAVGPNFEYKSSPFGMRLDYKYIGSDAEAKSIGSESSSHNVGAKLRLGSKVNFLAKLLGKFSSKNKLSAETGAGVSNLGAKGLTPYAMVGYENDNFNNDNYTYGILGLAYTNDRFNFAGQFDFGQKTGIRLTPSYALSRNVSLTGNVEYMHSSGSNSADKSDTRLFAGIVFSE